VPASGKPLSCSASQGGCEVQFHGIPLEKTPVKCIWIVVEVLLTTASVGKNVLPTVRAELAAPAGIGVTGVEN
jgi:hypothetical protein